MIKDFENEWTRSDVAQKISIKELEEKNRTLIVQLHDAEAEIATLKLEVARLENGQLALTIKLNDATSEVGRLSMIVKPPQHGEKHA